MSTPDTRRASVRVPASTSNLGAGFDCVGLAIDKWLRVSAEVRVDGRGEVSVLRTGTLRALDRAGLPDARQDLIYVGFEALCKGRIGSTGFDGAVHFEADSDIPVARGLGSSAAALLAGAALANETLELGRDTCALAQICARIEGHGDNVGASALGGAILVTPKWQALLFTPLAVHESLGFAFAVPDFETRTELARASLPDDVAYRLARALHRAEGVFGKRLEQAQESTLANTLVAAPSRDLIHPGVLRYMREIGLLI